MVISLHVKALRFAVRLTPPTGASERITNIDAAPTSLADALSSPNPTVIDLIPTHERAEHTYIRGASLGAIAYNLFTHDMLNTARDVTDPHMHFAAGRDAYSYADRVARSIARGEGYTDIQLRPEMRTFLTEHVGHPVPHIPGIVFALHPDFNDYLLRPSDRGAQEGVIWDGAVTLDMIDEHTRAALERMLLG